MLLLFKSVLLLWIVIRGAKSQLNSITELATRHEEKREATEIQLEIQKYNSRTYKLNVIK